MEVTGVKLQEVEEKTGWDIKLGARQQALALKTKQASGDLWDGFGSLGREETLIFQTNHVAEWETVYVCQYKDNSVRALVDIQCCSIENNP